MRRYYGYSENQSALTGVPPLRYRHGKAYVCAARRISTSPRGTKSEARNARTKTQGQARPCLWPRPCRLEDFDRRRIIQLAGEFFPGEALANCLTDRQIEPVRVIHLAAIIVAKHLFIQIAEKVKRFHRNVGAA